MTVEVAIYTRDGHTGVEAFHKDKEMGFLGDPDKLYQENTVKRAVEKLLLDMEQSGGPNALADLAHLARS